MTKILKGQGVLGVVACITGLLLAVTAVPTDAMRLDTVLPKQSVMHIVVDEAERLGLDPALALAVADVESGFRTHAESHAGARGVMQIMPATAWDEFGIAPSRLYDARTNVATGVRFLKQLLDRYDRLDIALSHYNGGSAVRSRSGYLRVIPATRGYVNKVIGKMGQYRSHPLVLASMRHGYDDFESPYAAVATVSDEDGKLIPALQALRASLAERFGWVDDEAAYSEMTSRTTEQQRRLEELRSW